MALAKKCDRCGKMYEHYPIGIYNGFKLVRCTLNGETSFEKTHEDLCPDCMRKFGEWINMKGE